VGDKPGRRVQDLQDPVIKKSMVFTVSIGACTGYARNRHLYNQNLIASMTIIARHRPEDEIVWIFLLLKRDKSIRSHSRVAKNAGNASAYSSIE